MNPKIKLRQEKAIPKTFKYFKAITALNKHIKIPRDFIRRLPKKEFFQFIAFNIYRLLIFFLIIKEL
jgi:hypothetical protein